jgi:hypothetical protein
MLGDDARFVSVPPDVDFAFACHVAEPAVVEAVAPSPPPLVAPYVIVNVEPPATVSEETVIVCPETERVPELAVVYPAAVPVVDGALQPLGTSSVTEPPEMPPAAAVYVNVIVFPLEPFATFDVGVVSVPVPSAASTVMLGDDARFVSDPADVDFSFACHVCAPVVDVAVAPGPPEPVSPYVIVNVLPPATVSEETVIVWPETERLPELAVV